MKHFSEGTFAGILTEFVLGAGSTIDCAVSTRSPVCDFAIEVITNMTDLRIFAQVMISLPPTPSKADEDILVYALDVLSHQGQNVRWRNGHSIVFCIIQDKSRALLAHEIKNGEIIVSIIEGKECERVNTFFEEYWSYSHEEEMLFEDFFRIEQPEFRKEILVVGNKFWSDLISELSRNPEKLYGLPPRQFEELVAELLLRMGHKATLTPETHDGGFDIICTAKDSLGKHLYLVECKRYSKHKPVRVGVIRELNGVVGKKQASGGLVVTTSYFTSEALKEAQDLQYRISLKAFDELKNWIDRYFA